MAAGTVPNLENKLFVGARACVHNHTASREHVRPSPVAGSDGHTPTALALLRRWLPADER